MILEDKNYRIVYEPDEADIDGTMPEALDAEMEDLYIKANKGKPSVKGRLEKLIKRYPNLPFLRNFLAKWYEVNNQPEAAYRINEEILQLFPGYIFAVAYMMDVLLKKQDLEGASLLLAGRLDIGSFYPGRKAFHLSEFRAAVSIAATYLAACGRYDEARERIALLAEADIDTSLADMLSSNVERQAQIDNIKRMAEMAELEVHADQREEATLPQRDVAVSPANDMFAFLHCPLWHIDNSQLRDAMDNHREAFIKELEGIITKAIEGYKYAETTNNNHDVVLHAMLILGYINYDGGFSTALDLMRQPPNLCWFWLGDWDSDVLTPHFKDFSDRKLERILAFVVERKANSQAKNAVLEYMSYFVVHNPESRGKIITCLKSILDHFIAHSTDRELFDSTVVAFAVTTAIKLKAIELIDTIRQLYAQNLVAITVAGELDLAIADIADQEDKIYVKFYDDVFAHLTALKAKLNGNNSRDKFSGMLAGDLFQAEDSKKDLPAAPVKATTFVTVSKNAPCPCGSGKKYKRCHGM